MTTCFGIQVYTQAVQRALQDMLMKTTKAVDAGFLYLLFKRGAHTLLLSVALSACGGGGGSDRRDEDELPVPDPIRIEAKAVVSGTLYFEFVPSRERCGGLDYNAIEQRPIRGATVQLLDVADGRVLDSTVAGEDGSYELAAPPGQQVFVRVRAELKSASPAWDVEVRNNTAATERPLPERPLYVLDGKPFELDENGGERQLIARSGWDGNAYSDPRAAAPFAVLDALYAAMSMVRQADAEAAFPPLDVFWSPQNGTSVTSSDFDARMSEGQVGTSFYSPAHRAIFLLGHAGHDTEEFDSHVIVHEWAHYFEHVFSRSDSPGGAHSLHEPLDKRLAFSEGWATALSGMVLGSSLYCDTSGPGQRQGFFIDMSNTPDYRAGWFSEWSMIRVLYALGASGEREGSFEFAELYRVFAEDQKNTQAFTSIFSFTSALKQRYPNRASQVNQLLSRYGIYGVDAYGNGEINNAGSRHPDVLPVYNELVADGSGLEVCVNDEFDIGRTGNKLAQTRFLRLRIEHPGLYQLSVQTVNPPTASNVSGCPAVAGRNHSDPDFHLLSGGQVLVSGTGCASNREHAQIPLSQGNYVMAVAEKRFSDSHTAPGFPGRICFEVKATPAF